MDIIEKYSKEIEEDAKIDRFSLTDKQMLLPGIKHKWVARLIQHKEKVQKLKKLKKLTKIKLINKFESESNVSLSKVALDNKAENDQSLKDIQDKIQQEELVILYLEKVETILRAMSYDIKNIVDLIKIEET